MAVIEQFVSDLSGKNLDDETAAKVRIERPGADRVQVLDVHVDELGAFEGKGVLVAKRGRKPAAA